MPTTKILAFRKKKRITQKQLADLAGTSQQQIHRIETGKQSARFDLAVRICSALDDPVEAIFPGTTKPLAKMAKKHEKSSTQNLHDEEFLEEMAHANNRYRSSSMVSQVPVAWRCGGFPTD